jgi:hypothetical protein
MSDEDRDETEQDGGIRLRGTELTVRLDHEAAAGIRGGGGDARAAVEAAASKVVAKVAPKVAAWSKRHAEAVERGKAARAETLRIDSDKFRAAFSYLGRSMDVRLDELSREQSKTEEVMRAADRDAEDAVEMLAKIRDEAAMAIAAAVAAAVTDRTPSLEAERDSARAALLAAAADLVGRFQKAKDGLAILAGVKPSETAIRTLEARFPGVFTGGDFGIAPFPRPERVEAEEEVERTWHPAPFPASYG